MKLYHGTSTRYLKRILKNGIQPREEKAGNWKHTIQSNPDAVYLTEAYALYYAMAATTKSHKMVVFEIDSNKLNPFNFVPDEDFLSEIVRLVPDQMPEAIKDATEHRVIWEYFRDNLLDYSHMWEKSVKGMGNCAYVGSIRPDAITRYAVLDMNVGDVVFGCGCDPTISILNYRYRGEYYKNLTKFLFKDQWDSEDYPSKDYWNKIEVIENEMASLSLQGS